MTVLRPRWLADDEQWREQLTALPDDETDWLAQQWEMAGGKPPDLDRSWITTESIGAGWDSVWVPIGMVVAFAVLCFGGLIIVNPQ